MWVCVKSPNLHTFGCHHRDHQHRHGFRTHPETYREPTIFLPHAAFVKRFHSLRSQDTTTASPTEQRHNQQLTEELHQVLEPFLLRRDKADGQCRSTLASLLASCHALFFDTNASQRNLRLVTTPSSCFVATSS